MLINLKLLTIENSFLLNITEHENFFANKYENANYFLAEKIWVFEGGTLTWAHAFSLDFTLARVVYQRTN